MNTVVLSGIFTGLIYGLLALGLTLTYRVSRVVNFGYGEIGMLSFFVYLEVRTGVTREAVGLTGTDRGVVLPMVVALAFGALLGVIVERVVARPARGTSTLNGMLGTVAVGSLLLVVAAQRYGADSHVAVTLIGGEGVELGGLRIQPAQLLTLACAAVILPALAALYRYTSLGVRLRATAIDPFAASLCGIDVNSVARVTWALAGALSALSAMLIASVRPGVTIFFMSALIIRALVAALIGGLTSLWAGFAAGLTLGVFEAVVQFKSPVTGVTELTIAVGILTLMLVRPSGLVRTQY